MLPSMTSSPTRTIFAGPPPPVSTAIDHSGAVGEAADPLVALLRPGGLPRAAIEKVLGARRWVLSTIWQLIIITCGHHSRRL